MNRFKKIWHFLRQITGDSAYEDYILSCDSSKNNSSIITERQFYMNRIYKKFSDIKRCC